MFAFFLIVAGLGSVKKEFMVEPVRAQSCGSDGFAALASALTKETPLTHVDFGEKLKGMVLTGLPEECWPSAEAIDGLATKASKIKKSTHVDKPYVFVDLKK